MAGSHVALDLGPNEKVLPVGEIQLLAIGLCTQGHSIAVTVP
jgi:hypothetical protein